MDDGIKKQGSAEAFDLNWKNRQEAVYNHWVKGKPQNQIQLAFRQHWLLFQELMEGNNYKTCLEVGCGRGSISSYFADNGLNCTLLDSSESVLNTAKVIFKANGHTANFVHGNALDLPFTDYSFDVVVSIGLLEHFEEVDTPIKEQFRVLKPDGLFLGYIVPEKTDNIQKSFRWLNRLLAVSVDLFNKSEKNATKTDIYRSDFMSAHYLTAINDLTIKDLQVYGVYPLPMISHSPEFPFSLMPKFFEKVLVFIFECILWLRKRIFKRNPWTCSEKLGQAFLIAFKKVA